MSLRAKIETACALVALGLALLFAYHWHEDAMLQAVARAQDAAAKQSEKAIDDKLAQRESQWKQERQGLLDQIKASQKQTPQQIVLQLPKVAPDLPAPIQIQPVTDNTGKTEPKVIVPDASVQPLFQQLAEGNVCKLDLKKCSADLGDQAQKTKLEHDRAENWQKAAKGGGWRQRAVRTLKIVGCAGGGAAIGSIKGWQGAAVGGMVGAGVCSFSF